MQPVSTAGKAAGSCTSGWSGGQATAAPAAASAAADWRTMAQAVGVTAAAGGDGGPQVYTGGIDNSVKVWDLRKEEVVMGLVGHTDTITGMAVSPDGTHLLTNAMDNALREWDMRPYAAENRCTKVRLHPACCRFCRAVQTSCASCPSSSSMLLLRTLRTCLDLTVTRLSIARPATVFSVIQVFTGHVHNFEKNLLKCAYSSDGSQVYMLQPPPPPSTPLPLPPPLRTPAPSPPPPPLSLDSGPALLLWRACLCLCFICVSAYTFCRAIALFVFTPASFPVFSAFACRHVLRGVCR